MRVRPWEVWKARPPGFETDHWFVIISGQERCDEPRHLCVNGLACFTHRGRLGKTEGMVSWERQQAIKSKVREVLRF